MTEQQLKNLHAIGQAIRNGHEQVSESFAVGQVMLVTGRTWDQALKGVKLMQTNNVLPTGWIKPETVGVLERMVADNPTIKKFFDRFDVVPGKTEVIEFQGYVKPRPVDETLLLQRFKLPEF